MSRKSTMPKETEQKYITVNAGDHRILIPERTAEEKDAIIEQYKGLHRVEVVIGRKFNGDPVTELQLPEEFDATTKLGHVVHTTKDEAEFWTSQWKAQGNATSYSKIVSKQKSVTKVMTVLLAIGFALSIYGAYRFKLDTNWMFLCGGIALCWAGNGTILKKDHTLLQSLLIWIPTAIYAYLLYQLYLIDSVSMNFLSCGIFIAFYFISVIVGLVLRWIFSGLREF